MIETNVEILSLIVNSVEITATTDISVNEDQERSFVFFSIPPVQWRDPDVPNIINRIMADDVWNYHVSFSDKLIQVHYIKRMM